MISKIHIAILKAIDTKSENLQSGYLHHWIPNNPTHIGYGYKIYGTDVIYKNKNWYSLYDIPMELYD